MSYFLHGGGQGDALAAEKRNLHGCCRSLPLRYNQVPD
jgi:hypothetical protein